MDPRTGEIYWYGVERAGRRPAIVVSREELNRGGRILIVPITSKKYEIRSELPNCVPFRVGEYGFDRNCVAQAENITLVEMCDLDVDAGPFAVLDEAVMRNLVRAIGYVISAECEPV